jgi:multisubunit Na+/H+ antiporter MnhC subunit
MNVALIIAIIIIGIAAQILTILLVVRKYRKVNTLPVTPAPSVEPGQETTP